MPAPARQTNPDARDRLVRRVGLLGRALGVAAVAAAAALSAAAAHAFKGHDGRAHTARADVRARHRAVPVHVPPPQHVPAIAGIPELRPPPAPPAAAVAPPPVDPTTLPPVEQVPQQVSGGS